MFFAASSAFSTVLAPSSKLAPGSGELNRGVTFAQLIPLVVALAARPGSDAAELTRMARQVTTTRA